MSITVKQAREALEAAKYAHDTANVEHPTELILAKEALNAARFDYHEACAALCTLLEFKTSIDQVESELVAHGLWA